jgi:hypothetical protein
MLRSSADTENVAGIAPKAQPWKRAFPDDVRRKVRVLLDGR